MKRVLALTVLMAFMPTVHAQDKGKPEFTVNAEFRVRDTFEQNESGSNSIQPDHHNGIDQRFKLGLGFRANEKFAFTGTLLQSASWGQAQGETLGDRGSSSAMAGDAVDEKNFMSVNEAYATWMMSENLHAKIGRMNFGFCDGSVMAVNDYEAQPYSYDGVTANYELEFGRFTAFAFKFRDYSGTLPATTSDPQHDALGLVFDLKTMPEWLKAVNAHVIQDNSDAVWGGPNTAPTVQSTQNINTIRYGLGISFMFGAFDLKADGEMVNGYQSDAGSGGAVPTSSQFSVNQSMYQAEAGFNMPGLMGSRFWLGYHQDSGTSAGNKTTKNNTYDGYFHDLVSGSGMMEIVGWGNLTDLSLGWNVKPTDSTTVGADAHMFSKTNADDMVHGGTYGQTLFALNATNSSSSKSIGNEYDLWAEHKYDGGLSMLARLGYFTPGSSLKDTAINKTASIAQVMLQGKLTF